MLPPLLLVVVVVLAIRPGLLLLFLLLPLLLLLLLVIVCGCGGCMPYKSAFAAVNSASVSTPALFNSWSFINCEVLSDVGGVSTSVALTSAGGALG